MDVLIMPMGSAGDHHPLMGVGVGLGRRGHRVTVYTHGHFQTAVENAGLEYVEIGDAAEYRAVMQDPDLWHPVRGFKAVMGNRMMPEFMRRQYQAIADRQSARPIVVLAGSLALGARVAREKLDFLLVTAHLQPMVLRSCVEPPASPAGQFPSWLPRWFIGGFFWLADTVFIDPVVRTMIEPLRRDLGLPPVRRYLRDWWHSPDLTLGLFPAWFGTAPDWPADVRLTDFPLYDERGNAPLPDAVRSFLDSGPPPVVVTFGSAMQHGHAPFAAAVEACRQLGRRAVLLTPYAHQVPATLPPGIAHFDYVPFSQLLPHAAALVHHGGIGTCAQALATGVPQLLMPLAHDQPDNGHRLEKLGVARTLYPRRFTAAKVAQVLGEMLSDPKIADTCRNVAKRLDGIDPTRAACDRIEEAAGRRSVPSLLH